jgi:hypothetical protein
MNRLMKSLSWDAWKTNCWRLLRVSRSYSICHCTVWVVPLLPLLLLQAMIRLKPSRQKAMIRLSTCKKTDETRKSAQALEPLGLSLSKRFCNLCICYVAIPLSEKSRGRTCLVCWPYLEPVSTLGSARGSDRFGCDWVRLLWNSVWLGSWDGSIMNEWW